MVTSYSDQLVTVPKTSSTKIGYANSLHLFDLTLSLHVNNVFVTATTSIDI